MRKDTLGGVATQTTRLRAGIVGAGLMGRWHAAAIKRAGGCVGAVQDVNPESARRLAAGLRQAESFSDLGAMLNQARLDVLHICTPPATHQWIAECALEAGLHLLIEKPLTPAAHEAVCLFERAAERRLLVCPVHQFPFQDGALRAGQSLSEIGPLVHLEGVFCSAGGIGHRAEQLDVIAAEILPHPLSLLQKFLPNGLQQPGWVTMRPGDGELRVLGELSGVTLAIFISLNARPTQCSFTIMGTRGTIHLDMFHGYAFREPGTVSKTRKIVHPFDLGVRRLSAASTNLARRAFRRETAYPGLQRLVGSFYEAVRTGSPSPISPEDALTVAQVRDTILQSAGLDQANPS